MKFKHKDIENIVKYFKKSLKNILFPAKVNAVAANAFNVAKMTATLKSINNANRKIFILYIK